MKQIATLLSISLCILVTPTTAGETHLVSQAPAKITEVAPDVFLVDFQRVAFGNLRLTAPDGASKTVTIHFGEALSSGRIDRKPPGTVRYAQTKVTLAGNKPVVAAPPANSRNTEQTTDKHPPAVLTPSEWGVVLPFRWVEIEGWPGELRPEQIRRQAAFSSAWDDEAAAFQCSDEMLNQIWDLCRYSIKATTFAGVYVDGDRERIPYEADAYLNQLSHYATDNDIQIARDTFDWLMKHPTWPTEWAPHMVFMAYADWMHTGDQEWLAAHYDALKSKLLMDRVGADGLVVSSPQHVKRDDIVDWPKGERDGYVFTPINTVVNAFHIRAVKLMAEMATAIGRSEDAAEFAAHEQKAREVFHARLFDRKQGLYRDGMDTDHISLHANLFPLAFDLVPERHQTRIADWLAKRGMACSVYAAQYLMEGLFKYGKSKEALDLITAPGDRSWRHMVQSGTTISWEAWDLKYKPNQDWNHAWGAAPANLLPRFVLGVQPLTPGWQKARIRPQVGSLSHAEGKVPTPHGPILVSWTNDPGFTLRLTLPKGVTARVDLPAEKPAATVLVDAKPTPAQHKGDRLVLKRPVSGTCVLEVQ